ncbi:hypothetical protein [Mucilaginibacter aquatilis]|uniref:DUF4252 domain-containing protein n=1 Tax=Mucilaginibacter aquatilis TaxID=1517760 RepID=A0A6I4IBL5_9SPHI|nr:hypothetical protein [Mucilaginibacter aquatilis]MVN92581.1 hypothetical protein [Mucilaginibacter aquatilis]
MKTLRLFSACLLTSAYTFAQDTTGTHLVTFSLPKKVQKLSKQQYLDYGKKSFNKSYTALPNDHVYLTEGLLVTIRDRETESTKKRTLEQLKREMEEVIGSGNGTYTQSRIVTVDNRKFYIFEFYIKNEGHLSFYTDYIGNKNKNTVGVIDFKRPDEAKAHKHLEDILKGMRFTDDTLN